MKVFGVLLSFFLTVSPLLAHRVLTTAHQEKEGRVIYLRYADGKPFANEVYALFNGETFAQITGKTDREGRVYLPQDKIDWRIKAWSHDGHGVDQKILSRDFLEVK